MLQAIVNKSGRQHPTRHQLYGHLPPITKTIQVRRTRHAGHCWRSRDELISDVLLWTPTYGRAKAGRPARTYIQQLCEDTGCSPEDLPEAMNDREKWRERAGIFMLAVRHDDDDDNPHKHTHTPTHTHTLTIARRYSQKSQRFFDSVFSIFDSFYGIKYINLIYIYLLLLYNSSILDIEHSPYHIALGSIQTQKLISWQPTLL